MIYGDEVVHFLILRRFADSILTTVTLSEPCVMQHRPRNVRLVQLFDPDRSRWVGLAIARTECLAGTKPCPVVEFGAGAVINDGLWDVHHRGRRMLNPKPIHADPGHELIN